MTMTLFYAVTLAWSIGDNPANHLHLGRQLCRLFAHHCTCRSGKRTNASCCHVTAATLALCCPEAFRTAKKREARLFDINRPDEQQPTSSGTPANAVLTPAQVVQPCPQPPRVSRDTRVHTRDDLCVGFLNPVAAPPVNPRDGYGVHLAAPTAPVQVPQQQVRRQQVRQPPVQQPQAPHHLQPHPSGLGNMLNPG
jgi:hypothetical protein